MKTIEEASSSAGNVTRRSLLRVLGVGAAVTAATAVLSGCGGSSNNNSSTGTSEDQQILNAAATAEGLASTMYANIITSSLYTAGLSGNTADQAYLVAAFEQEVLHYNLLLSVGAKPLAFTFYFPSGMFGSSSTYATTINTLVTLEDAFIAAYLIGISSFSSTGNKVLAGQILGVESEHRTLARVIANDLSLGATTGLSGSAESVVPPSHASNNIAYERRFGLTSISQVVTALGPFVTAGSSGFGATAYPLITTLPSSVSPGVTLDSTAPTS
jgi:hypothetical protein